MLYLLMIFVPVSVLHEPYKNNTMFQNSLSNKVHHLDIGHNQILQDIVVKSSQLILLVFESQYQLWNISTNTKFMESAHNQSIFYFCYNTFVSDYVVAFISYEPDKPHYLGTYNLKTNQIQNLTTVPQNDNHLGLISFEDETLIVISYTKVSKAITFSNSKITETSFSQNTTIKKYNSKDAYTVFNQSQKQKKLQFMIVREGNQSKFNIQGLEQGVITQIKQFDASRAIILTNNNAYSGYGYLVDLEKGVIQNSCKLQFEAQYIIKGPNEVWLGCQTVEEQNNSQIRVKELFSDKPMISKKIESIQRVQNDFYPCLLITCSNGVATIYNYCTLKKQTNYIKFLESLGIIEEFGAEIVKSVINNLI